MPRSTKQDILDTLIELLRERRLDEISVKDLTERCGISRQAFYYHFADIYAAVEWGVKNLLDQMVTAVAGELETGDEREIREEVLEKAEALMLKNRTVVLNAYRAYERSYINYHLTNWARPIMLLEVERRAEGIGVTREQISFVAELCVMMLISILLNWLDMGMPGGTIKNLDDFQTAVNGSVTDMLRRLEQKNKKGE